MGATDRAVLAANAVSEESFDPASLREIARKTPTDELRGIKTTLRGLGALIDCFERDTNSADAEVAYPDFMMDVQHGLDAIIREVECATDKLFDTCDGLYTAERAALRDQHRRGLLEHDILSVMIQAAAGLTHNNYPLQIEDVRAAGHALGEMADANPAFCAARNAYLEALKAQGWQVRWTVLPNNTRYLELTSPKR